MSQYVLDIIVKSAELDKSLKSLKGDFFLKFKVDGNQQNVFTPNSPPSNLCWNYSFRIILTLADISSAFLYAYLCVRHNGKDRNIGMSKVCIKALPVGYPKNFTFPVMNPKNTAITTAKLNLTAALSALVPTPGKYYSNPVHSTFGPMRGNEQNVNTQTQYFSRV